MEKDLLKIHFLSGIFKIFIRGQNNTKFVSIRSRHLDKKSKGLFWRALPGKHIVEEWGRGGKNARQSHNVLGRPLESSVHSVPQGALDSEGHASELS